MFFKKEIGSFKVTNTSELKKRTRIVVIDDDKNSFPTEVLKAEGYAIDYWPQVDNISKLEEGAYDIIILDIQNVAKKFSKDDGLGVLEHLKDRNPSQIIVAFSGQTFSLSKNKFWKLADDALPKPVDALTCKKVIDDLIETKMTPQHYWNAFKSVLQKQGVQSNKIDEIEDKLARALEKGNPNDAEKIIEKILSNSEKAISLGKLAAKMVTLFHGVH